jgi:hypothetical protein
VAVSRSGSAKVAFHQKPAVFGNRRMLRVITFILIVQTGLHCVGALAQPIESDKSPDEVAMVLGTLLVAQRECNVRIISDTALQIEIAKLGQDLNDFMIDGRYAQVVRVKINKAFEFVAAMGKARACNAMKDVLKRYLKDAVAFGPLRL